MIVDTTWKVSGVSDSAKAYDIYTSEVTNATKTYGSTDGISKIGLIYLSDYGYAASPSAWTSNISLYRDSSIKSVNWMYIGQNEWSLSPYSSNNHYVYRLSDDGTISYLSTVASYGVRPTFYLNLDVKYEMGYGTKNSPIRITD